MSQGRSISLFLVDGTPNGLLTSEIMNWTGHVLTGPRSKLVEGTGQSYAAWQEAQVAGFEPSAESE